MVRPTVHTNTSRKQSFSQMLFKPEDLKTPALSFMCTENTLKTKLIEDDDLTIIM